MSLQSRPNWYNASPRQNDSKEIWMAGYGVTLATEFTPDLDQSDSSEGVYGYTGTIDSKVLNAGTLTMRGMYDRTMQVMYDVATDIDPRTTGVKVNYPRNAFLDIARLTRDVTGKYYETVELYAKTSFAITPPSGAPKEKGQISFSGRCDLPVVMNAAAGKGLAITWDVIALSPGANSTLTGDFSSYQPLLIPAAAPNYPNAGKFALTLEIQVRSGATGIVQIQRYAHLPITATNVITGTTKGRISISENDLLGTNISASDSNLYAYVSFLYEVTPNGSTNYLLGDGVECRGRFDWPGSAT